MYPESLSNAINSFKRLPGIGEKSAERFALSILDLDEEEIEEFSKSIKTCKEKLHRCKTCGHLTDKDECVICTDSNRKDNVICVVEDPKNDKLIPYVKGNQKTFWGFTSTSPNPKTTIKFFRSKSTNEIRDNIYINW